MGIKKDIATNTWTVSYSRRPQPKMSPISRTVKGIQTKAEAEKVLQKLIREISDKANLKISPLWSKVVEEYFEYSLMRGISHKTIKQYGYSINAHTMAIWGNRQVDKITSREIADVIQQNLAESTNGNKQYVLKAIRQVFNFALDQDWILRNPTPNIHFKKMEKIKGVLTKDQVAHLLNTAKDLNHNWYPHWFMALYTGMRNGELYALTWDKVDLENNLIKVDTAWNSIDGFKSTKSGDDRILEIAPDLRILLAELKLKSAGVSFVLPRIPSWDKGDQARELRMFLLGLKLPEIRFHDLRATWATLLLSQGIEAIKVMKMGGWKDIKTMQIYIRKAGIDIKGCMNDFSLHNPHQTSAKVYSFGSGS